MVLTYMYFCRKSSRGDLRGIQWSCLYPKLTCLTFQENYDKPLDGMVVPYVQTKPYFIRFPIQLGYFICYRLSWAIDYNDMVITCESCDNWDTHGTNTIISAFPHGYPDGMMCSRMIQLWSKGIKGMVLPQDWSGWSAGSRISQDPTNNNNRFM